MCIFSSTESIKVQLSRLFGSVIILSIFIISNNHVEAQVIANWPTKAIHVVSPFPPGGLADSTARLVAERLSSHLGQPVVVENKPGASATIGTEYVVNSKPDGYTLLMSFSANITITPHMQPVRYDPIKDLIPIAKLTGYYGIIAVNSDTVYSDYRDFVNDAKQNPDKFVFGSNGVGTTSYLIASILHKQTGIRLLHIPYKGSAEFLTDLLAHRIDIIYDAIALPQIQAGKLKALATIAPDRHPLLPNIKTLKELGFDMINRNWFAIFAPKGTSSEIVAKVSNVLNIIMKEPDLNVKLTALSQYPEYLPDKEFRQRVAEDSDFFGRFIKENEIK